MPTVKEPKEPNPAFRKTGVGDWVTVTDNEGEPDYLTLDSVRDITPDDPSPGESLGEDRPAAIKITPGVRRDIEGKLAFMFSMTSNMWQMVDPVCGSALLENTPEISKRLTPVICQSPSVVAWFKKSSNIMLYIALLQALWPVLSAIYMHHIVKAYPPSKQLNDQMNGQAPASPVPNEMYTVR